MFHEGLQFIALNMSSLSYCSISWCSQRGNQELDIKSFNKMLLIIAQMQFQLLTILSDQVDWCRMKCQTIFCYEKYKLPLKFTSGYSHFAWQLNTRIRLCNTKRKVEVFQKEKLAIINDQVIMNYVCHSDKIIYNIGFVILGSNVSFLQIWHNLFRLR